MTREQLIIAQSLQNEIRHLSSNLNFLRSASEVRVMTPGRTIIDLPEETEDEIKKFAVRTLETHIKKLEHEFNSL